MSKVSLSPPQQLCTDRAIRSRSERTNRFRPNPHMRPRNGTPSRSLDRSVHMAMSTSLHFGTSTCTVRDKIRTVSMRQRFPKFIDLLLTGEPPVIFGDGEQTRDFVYVGDIVTANIEAALSDRTSVYNVATGESVTINELVDTLKTIIGTDVSPTHEGPRTSDIRHSSASVSKAAEEIGFRVNTSLENGLTKTVNRFRSI